MISIFSSTQPEMCLFKTMGRIFEDHLVDRNGQVIRLVGYNADNKWEIIALWFNELFCFIVIFLI